MATDAHKSIVIAELPVIWGRKWEKVTDFFESLGELAGLYFNTNGSIGPLDKDYAPLLTYRESTNTYTDLAR